MLINQLINVRGPSLKISPCNLTALAATLTIRNMPRTGLRRSERPPCSSCRYATAMRLATLLLPNSTGACFHKGLELSQYQTFRCSKF
jgi:hypothetical protein